MSQLIFDFIRLMASLLAVAVVLTMHEFAHAFTAYKCGDPTPKYSGRLSLNPMRHFDILGLVLFAFAGFGWAKPVPINPNNFRHYKRGLTFTAIAGVVTNYLSAFIFYPLMLIVITYVQTPLVALDSFLYYFFLFLYSYSLAFSVFNLIPLPPLDGWRVVEAVNRKRGKIYRFFEQYGYIILLVLIGIHFLVNILSGYQIFALAAQIFSYVDVLGYILDFVTLIVSKPITLLWGLVF